VVDGGGWGGLARYGACRAGTCAARGASGEVGEGSWGKRTRAGRRCGGIWFAVQGRTGRGPVRTSGGLRGGRFFLGRDYGCAGWGARDGGTNNPCAPATRHFRGANQGPESSVMGVRMDWHGHLRLHALQVPDPALAGPTRNRSWWGGEQRRSGRGGRAFQPSAPAGTRHLDHPAGLAAPETRKAGAPTNPGARARTLADQVGGARAAGRAGLAQGVKVLGRFGGRVTAGTVVEPGRGMLKHKGPVEAEGPAAPGISCGKKNGTRIQRGDWGRRRGGV